MKIVVQKYGGSSVADIDKIKRVAEKVVRTREAGYAVVVVVSAMGNTTNELLALARQTHANPSRRELDMLLSVGERIAMALLSMCIQAMGHEAISFTGSQSGIVTTASHSAARIIAVRPYRIQDELERGQVVIVAGYQGTSYRNEITTLGRGGSDMTAVALAGALGAEACEIYSDVDGVYTGDPRVVLDARRLDEVGAEEMLELARHGAKVLHDEAVAYACRHDIALHAKATHLESSKGTLIRRDGWPARALEAAQIAPKAVASLPQVVLVKIAVTDAAAFWASLVPFEPGVALVSTWCSAGAMWIVLDPTNGPEVGALHLAFEAAGGGAWDVSLGWATVSVVGQDIGRASQWVQAVAQCLGERGVEVEAMWSQHHGISVLVAQGMRNQVQQVLHTLVPGGRAEGAVSS